MSGTQARIGPGRSLRTHDDSHLSRHSVLQSARDIERNITKYVHIPQAPGARIARPRAWTHDARLAARHSARRAVARSGPLRGPAPDDPGLDRRRHVPPPPSGEGDRGRWGGGQGEVGWGREGAHPSALGRTSSAKRVMVSRVSSMVSRRTCSTRWRTPSARSAWMSPAMSSAEPESSIRSPVSVMIGS